MTLADPDVGVVVPAHGDVQGLTRLLGSFDHLDYPPDRFHVVVAVDGPDEVLERVLSERIEGGATWLSFLVLPENRGSYAARNAAIDALPADVQAVLFTDADGTVTPGWVRAHLGALGRAPRSGGPIRVTHHEPMRPVEWVDMHRHFNQEHNVKNLGVSVTANLAVRRSVLDIVRFDDAMRSGGDFDFGRRAQEAGFPIVFEPDAVVEHPARSTLRALLRKVDRVGRGAHRARLAGDKTDRRQPGKLRARSAARRAGIEARPLWYLRVGATDLLCSVAYRRHQSWRGPR